MRLISIQDLKNLELSQVFLSFFSMVKLESRQVVADSEEEHKVAQSPDVDRVRT